MKVAIPKSVTVGSFDYRITYSPKLVYDHSKLGQCVTDSQLIKIEPDTTIETKNQALFHEIVHAINDVYNCELNEMNIDRIAQGITAVLKNDFKIELDWKEIK